MKIKKCTKWKHDFSYEGKKKTSQINCKKCGINMIAWIEARVKEFE